MNLWLIKFVTTVKVELMMVRKKQQQDAYAIKTLGQPAFVSPAYH